MPDPVNIPRLGYLSEAQVRALVDAGGPDQLLVVGIIGDSNSDGGGGTIARPEQLPGEQDGPVDGILSLSAALSLIPARMPLAEGEASINMDPGMSLGKYLLQAHGRGTRVLLVQCSVGGTSFVNDNWNPGDPDYEAAVVRINAALALPGARPGGLWINLGAIDQLTSGSIAAYPGAVTAMVAALRGGDLEMPSGELLESMPVVMTTTRFGDDPDKTTINNHIRGLSRTIDYCAIVEAEDLGSSQDEGDADDDVHFGPLARREVGRRVAHGLLEARIRHPLSRQFRASDVSKLDAIEAAAEVNVVETISNAGSGAQVAKAAAAKDVPLRSLLMPQGDVTQSTDDITLHPYPALPDYDVRLRATGTTGTGADIAIDSRDGVTATIALNIGVVGINGDSFAAAMSFSGSAAINIGTYTLPEEEYTIDGVFIASAFPASDGVTRRHLCGSQSTTGGQGWEVSLDRERTSWLWDTVAQEPVATASGDTVPVYVDQWWELRASHAQDAGVISRARIPNGRLVPWAAVYRSTGANIGRLQVYVDGILQHARSFPNPTDRSITVGAFNVGGFFVGAMPLIRFWNAALSPRQVRRAGFVAMQEAMGGPTIL